MLDIMGGSLPDLLGESVVMTAADGGAGSGRRPGWRWDVALSFAGAQRDYVEQVAEALRARGIRCFYDADEQIDLWGKYLAEELPVIYSERAASVVVFVSAEYAARDWTRLERRAALNRAVRERSEYVLPARFDDTPLPGLLSDMVAMDLRGRTPQEFAALIAAKLTALGITATTPPVNRGGPVNVVGSAEVTREGEADRISQADRHAPEKADVTAQVQVDRNGSKDTDPRAQEAGLPAGEEQAGSAGEEGDVAGAGDLDAELPPEPGDQIEADSAVPDDEDLTGQIRAMEAMDPYDAADSLINRPSDLAARILALMNPKAAAKVLAKLHEYGVAPEIITILESGALAKMLDELGPWGDTVRILELVEVRLAAATLSKMSWGGFTLTEMEPEIAAAIIEEMNPRELSKTLNVGGSLSPDPLDRLIDNISNERGLYLMSRIGTHRAANLLANMVQRSPGRADELLREMKPGLAGRIFGEVDLDAALGWIKRIDATASAQLLENMPPNKAAILLERIESGDAQELMSHMKPERLFYVRKIMGKPGSQAPADEG